MNSKRSTRNGLVALVAMATLSMSLSAETVNAKSRTKRRSKTVTTSMRSGLASTSGSPSSATAVSKTSEVQGQLSQTVSAPSAPAKKPKTGFSGGIASEYYPRVLDGQETFTDVALQVGYKIDEKNSVNVIQQGRVVGVVPTAEQPYQTKTFEFQGADTNLRYGRVLAKGMYGLDWSLRTDVTLPVSKTSVKNKVISRPTLMLLMSRKFFAEKLLVSYRPYYTYQISQYTTGADHKPLPQHFLGHVLIMGFDWTDWLSVEGLLLGAMNWDYDAPAPLAEGPKDMGSYAYDFSIGVSPVEALKVKIGYAQSDAFLKHDKYDVALYNPETTRYYLGAELSF